jgi:hypothetical protein
MKVSDRIVTARVPGQCNRPRGDLQTTQSFVPQLFTSRRTLRPIKSCQGKPLFAFWVVCPRAIWLPTHDPATDFLSNPRDQAGLRADPRRNLPIPMKSPGHSEMMPPMDSDMMSPRARASLAAEVVPLLVVDGQSFLAGLSRVRRRLSPVRSMRWALWTRRSRIASA